MNNVQEYEAVAVKKVSQKRTYRKRLTEAPRGEPEQEGEGLLARIRRHGGDVRRFEKKDAEVVAGWAVTAEEFRWISGQPERRLRAEDLRAWASRDEGYVLVLEERDAERVIGFATISQHEADLPKDHAEVCHLIIDPRYRRMKWGTRFLDYLSSLIALARKQTIVGRVEKDNVIAQSLLRQPDLGFAAVGKTSWDQEESAVWFTRAPVDFGAVVMSVRKEIGATQGEFARLLDVEKSLVSMLESGTRQPGFHFLSRLMRLAEDNFTRARIVRAAFGLGEPPQIHHYMTLSNELDVQRRAAQEVWVVTDRLAENISRNALEATADGIRSRRCRYVYFVPWDVPVPASAKSLEFQRLKQNLLERGVSDADIEAQVTCVLAPPIMFTARLALVNPDKDHEAYGILNATGSVDEYGAFFLKLPDRDVSRVHQELRYVTSTLDTEGPEMESSRGLFIKYFPRRHT